MEWNRVLPWLIYLPFFFSYYPKKSELNEYHSNNQISDSATFALWICEWIANPFAEWICKLTRSPTRRQQCMKSNKKYQKWTDLLANPFAYPRCERVGPQTHSANGWRSVHRFRVRMWRNLKSDYSGGIHLILIYWGGN